MARNATPMKRAHTSGWDASGGHERNRTAAENARLPLPASGRTNPVDAEAPSGARPPPLNYAVSISRRPTLAEDDPAAYDVMVTSTFLEPKPVLRTAARAGVRERWNGLVCSLDDVATSVAAFLPSTLVLRLAVKGSTIRATLEHRSP